MRLAISIFCLALISFCSTKESTSLDFLVGEWKVEGRDQYEVWEKNIDKGLSGYSYSLKDGKKKISETLSISIHGNQIILEATVPDQNEGKTVPFKLNMDVDGVLSFENDQHDFPKKIQYRKIDENRIKVQVSGDEGKGFSYVQVKQS